MPKLIPFDDSGLTTDCPKTDIGNQTFDICQACPSNRGNDGFNVKCSYDEPELDEEQWRDWAEKNEGKINKEAFG